MEQIRREQEEEQEQEEDMCKRHEKLVTLMANEGNKLCPKCNGVLKVRNGRRGPFYGCENYPNCKYTETIVLE